MRTIKLEGGKYEFDIEDGQMIAARRHGEAWPAGYEDRSNPSFMAALNRIIELEDQIDRAVQWALTSGDGD